MKVVHRLFGSARSIQVPWLLRDDCANGMPTDERRSYDAAMDESLKEWEYATRTPKRLSLCTADS